MRRDVLREMRRFWDDGFNGRDVSASVSRCARFEIEHMSLDGDIVICIRTDP